MIAGSRVRIDNPVEACRDWVATKSAAIEIRPSRPEARFLSVIVVPDAAPSLRIVDPGKDTAFRGAEGTDRDHHRRAATISACRRWR